MMKKIITLAIFFLLISGLNAQNIVSLKFTRPNNYNKDISKIKLYMNGEKIGTIANNFSIQFDYIMKKDSDVLTITAKGGMSPETDFNVEVQKGDVCSIEVGIKNNGKIYFKMLTHMHSSQ